MKQQIKDQKKQTPVWKSTAQPPSFLRLLSLLEITVENDYHVSMTNGTHRRDWQDILFIWGASNLLVFSGDATGELQMDYHNS